MIYRFGPFTFDTAAFMLSSVRAPVPLSPKALDVLAHLIARPAVLVTKEELFAALWPSTHVTDNALTQAVSELRRALGDEASKPAYIQTVARRGYRFLATVEVDAGMLEVPVQHRPRDTPSLDAYRAFSEGRLRLESFSTAEVPLAIADFKRAIELDPTFAAAYVGLANAHFWQYESTRYRADADTRLMALALDEARCAVQLDAHFAEAHGTLAYILVGAGDLTAAKSAASRALALQPNHWPHYFRLGHASWGEERLRALQQCIELYPDLPFAFFQMAMVHVARRHLTLAEQSLRQGLAVQVRHAERRSRFPANGLHWLLGLVHLSQGDVSTAVAEFEDEVEHGAGQLYATEFGLEARAAHGFALMRNRDVKGANETFRRALIIDGTYPRARLGLAMALRLANAPAKARKELELAREHIAAFELSGRGIEAAIMNAGAFVIEGKTQTALATLRRIVTEGPTGSAGWMIPVDPLLEPVRSAPGYDDLQAALAQRSQ